MLGYGFFVERVRCSRPYVAVSGVCCIDSNNNGVCDRDECLPEVTYAKNASGHCRTFPTTCVPENWTKVSVCPAETCFDGIQNCHHGSCETGVDCGGPCTVQYIPYCFDGIQNQNESGVDCGGPCPPCIKEPGEPTCFDGIMNQNETGVDCGGPCPPCLPSCFDGIQNGDETGVDCGGLCAACPTDIKFVWEYNLSQRVTDVDVSSNGKYVVIGSLDDHLYYLRNGSLIWRYNTRGDVVGVGISDDGTKVSVASKSNRAYFFTHANRTLGVSSYTKKFRYGISLEVMAAASDGKFVITAPSYNETSTDEEYRNDIVYVYDSDGEEKETYETDRDIVDLDISSGGGHYAAVSFDRVIKDSAIINMSWLYTTDWLNYVAVSSGGAVAAGNSNNVYYITGGNVSWSFNSSDIVDLDIANNNMVVVAANNLTALSSSGKVVWTYATAHPPLKVQISPGGGIVLAFTEDKFIHVLDGSGNLRWKYFLGGTVTSMRIAGSGSHIILGTYSGRVYLFKV